MAESEAGSSGTSSPPYEPGEVIVDYFQPVLTCLLNSCLSTHCSNCLTEKVQLQKCGSCGFLSYCSEKCRLQDWQNSHQVECGWLCRKNIIDYCRNNDNCYNFFALRFYAMLQMNLTLYLKEFPMFNKSSRTMGYLQPKEVLNESLRKSIELEHVNISALLEEVEDENSVRIIEFSMILEIIHSNKVKLFGNQDWKPIGYALSVELSIFPHSCKPTALVVNDGSKIQVRAIAQIPANRLPTVSYLFKMCSKADRQNILKLENNIECVCEICVSESESSVGFDNLRKLRKSLREYGSKDLKKDDFLQACSLRDDITKIIEPIYHEYDPRMTLPFLAVLDIAIKIGYAKEKFSTLMNSVTRRMRTTFGLDHPRYKLFESATAPYRLTETLPKTKKKKEKKKGRKN